MSGANLLRARIEASGLSARRFATRVMGRDERTIRRWLAGDTMPDSARKWLERLKEVEVKGESLVIRMALVLALCVVAACAAPTAPVPLAATTQTCSITVTLPATADRPEVLVTAWYSGARCDSLRAQGRIP